MANDIFDPNSIIDIDRRRRCEQQVVGAMMRDASVIDNVQRIIKAAACFHLYPHQVLFRTIGELHKGNKPTTAAAVAEHLAKRGELQDIGGTYYISELLDLVPVGAQCEYYANLLLDQFLLTEVGRVARDIDRDVRTPNASAFEMLQEFAHRLNRITEDAAHNEPELLADAMARQFAAIDDRVSGKEESGIPSGFVDLDKITNGFKAGELTLVGARPSVGKTSLGLNIASNMAEAGRRILFFSLEQSKAEISERLIARLSRIDSYQIQRGSLSKENLNAMLEAQSTMRKWKLFIEEAVSSSIGSIAATTRYLHRRVKLSAVFVDYLQLVLPENRRANRYEQVGEISQRLKQLARDLKIPVIVMCQVGRDAADDGSDSGDDKKKTNSKPPRLHHLRESGNLEQDTDVCLLMHRTHEGDVEANRPEIIAVYVAKNRNGRRGNLVLSHRPQFLRFENFKKGVDFQ